MTNDQPTFREALRFWLKLGCISFGGPAGQIAVMQHELVERKRWIDRERFLHALNFCMMLPGPEATQLAIWCGWRLHGTRGGLAAGILFVLPAALLLWGLTWIYAAHGHIAWLVAVFSGLKPAVVAIVAAAVLRLGAKALRGIADWLLAAAAFAALFFWHTPYPLIIALAAAVGFFSRRSYRWGVTSEGLTRTPITSDSRDHPYIFAPETPRSAWSHTARVLTIGVVLWFAPVVAAGLWQGWHGILAREGIFFSQAATVTFGGAYAVLPYVGQQATDNYHWLTALQMLDGLGLAETTPGPLIMVVQFVGFLGGWNQPGALSPPFAATLGAAMTTWTTFVPCFLWIFLGAPHLERLRSLHSLNAALAAVTAAVVGVVLNLAISFAFAVFFPVTGGGVDWVALALAVTGFIAMRRFQIGILTVVLASGVLGLVWGILMKNRLHA